MAIAWLAINFLFAVYQFVLNIPVTDVWVMVFWTGIFMVFAWLLFIILPLQLLDHSRQFFKPAVFPFITGLYGVLTFTILVGSIFWDQKLIINFSPLAFVAGLCFGLSYSLLIRADKLIRLLVDKPSLKIAFFLFPVILFGIFFAVNGN